MDGLRAVSVLGVVLYHFRIGCPGGYVGVDVFFVISGFLITNLILRRMDAGSFSLSEFWGRRVRRLAPALTAMVVCCLLLGPVFLSRTELRDLGRSAMAQGVLSANVYFWRHAGYFDAPSETKPLLHTWSLAVEEQFYLVYPLLLRGVCRRLRRPALPWVFALLAAVSFAGCVRLCDTDPSFNFYLLPTRAWEMLLGGLLVFVPAARPGAERSVVAEVLVLGGLAAIVWSMATYTSGTPFPGPLSLVPCVGAALVVGAGVRTRTLTGRLLELPALVLPGRMSYSLYLWHFPLYVFVRHVVVDPYVPAVQAGLVAGTAVCGWLSWRYVETPCRRRGATLAPRTLVAGWVASAALTVAAGAYVAASGPVVASNGETQKELPAEPVVHQCQGYDLKMKVDEYLTGDFVELGGSDKSLPVSVLINGDSHAMALMPLVHDLCRAHGIRGVGVACPNTVPFVGFDSVRSPLKEDCDRCQRAVIDYVRERRVPHVILVANFLNYAEVDKALHLPRSMVPEMRRGFCETVEAYRDSGATVWVMKQVPKYKWLVPTAMHAILLQGGDLRRVGLPESEHRANQALVDPVFDCPLGTHVRLLDPTPVFLDGSGFCLASDGLLAYYWDDNHVTDDGAALLRPLFEPAFRDAAQRLSSEPGDPRLPARNPPRDSKRLGPRRRPLKRSLFRRVEVPVSAIG